jgi:hypothetical protein
MAWWTSAWGKASRPASSSCNGPDLMAGLVATEGPATGATKLSEWLQEHSAEVGRVYASGLARHYR